MFHHSPVGVLQLARLVESDGAGEGLDGLLKGLQVNGELLQVTAAQSWVGLWSHLATVVSSTHLPAGEPAWSGTDRAPEFSPPSPLPACCLIDRPAEDPWKKYIIKNNYGYKLIIKEQLYELTFFFTAAMQMGQKSAQICWWIIRLYILDWASLLISFIPNSSEVPLEQSHKMRHLWLYIVPLSI